ncbi:MAG: hypothetical protein H0W50_03955 [Parachlamydiaceae bacterium]|nr:hypothetical protein [Parachlamydiaceae bacterium]
MPTLFKRILIIVVGLHGLPILLSLFFPFLNVKPAQKKIEQKVVVQTVDLNSYKPANSVAVSNKKDKQNQSVIASLPQLESPPETIIPESMISDTGVSEPALVRVNTPPKKPIVVKPASNPQTETKPTHDPKPISKTPPKTIPKTEHKSTPNAKPKPSIPENKPKPPPAAQKPVIEKPTPTLAPITPAVNKKTPTPQKNEKREKLLAQARESIGKIQKAPASAANSASKKPLTTQIEAPNLIGELQSDSFSLLGASASGNSFEEIYGSELINRLKLLLHLPGHGDVDIELTLAMSGKVISMKIIRDENRNNRIYIEKTIPSLSLPPFGSYFEGETQRTFVIRLTSQKG